MEKQRSFVANPTTTPSRLLFSITIPSSFLFCLLLSSHLLPSRHKQLPLPFNLTRPTSPNTTIFTPNPKDPILRDTHFPRPTNLSGVTPNSIHEQKEAVLAGAQPANPSQNATLNDTHLQTTIKFDSLEVRSEEAISSGSQNASSAVEKPVCDVFDGRWVYDESYPLYTGESCPFIDEGFGCEANGRMDRDYMRWRWQPHLCNIPRFNPKRFLELIRGKRLVFVGDSINRNQWESMLCLLRSAVSDPSRVYEARRRRITKMRGNYNFKFMDYQCSVEYYVSHFLVHESNARVGRRRTKTLRIDAIDRSSSRWRGADILVFNTAHWWSHYKTKAGVNYYQEGDHIYPRLDVSTAFRRAMRSWASWVDRHVSIGRTRVFFRSSSPSHFRGGEWNSGGHCMESRRPLNDSDDSRPNPEKNMIVEEVVKEMRTPVTILNITGLSGLRIDGHPSVYGKKSDGGSPTSSQDCSHWCLPGVPDAWNELLYLYLLSGNEQDYTNLCFSNLWKYLAFMCIVLGFLLDGHKIQSFLCSAFLFQFLVFIFQKEYLHETTK